MLPQIVTRVTLHPSKTPCLRAAAHMMRVLTPAAATTANSSTASRARRRRLLLLTPADAHDDSGSGGCCDDELVYGLMPASRLLVRSSGQQNVSPFTPASYLFVSCFLDLRVRRRWRPAAKIISLDVDLRCEGCQSRQSPTREGTFFL